MRYILLFVFILFSSPVFAASCDEQAPFGRPVTGQTDTIAICKTAYTLEYDPKIKIPVWVSYTLAPEHALGLPGCEPRSNRFHADDTLPVAIRAEKSDYSHSGYDIGHQANDGDMSWDAIVEFESFALSNMAPQLPKLNRGVWRVLEVNTRAWAWGLQSDMVVYVGPIYNAQDNTIGAGVKVPHSFYKIIINVSDYTATAFVMPNSSDVFNDIRAYQVSIAEVENQTGIKFPVNTDKIGVQPIWPSYLKKFNRARKHACR